MGCALAYQLARRGREVILLERAELGSQSTGKCAGGIRQQFSHETNVRLQRLAVKLLLDFEAEIGTPSDFRQIGYLFVLTSEALAGDFRAMVEMWHRAGLEEARWVSPAEIAVLSPLVSTSGVVGGTYCPSDGIAGPAEVTGGYAAAARRHGAQLREGVSITGVRLEGGAVAGVSTTEGDISCPVLFNCAGAWSAELGAMAGIEIPVRPYRRHVFVSDRFDRIQRDHPFVVDFETSFYFHPEGNGVLFGMSDREEPSTFDTAVRWDFLEKVVEQAARRAPALEQATVRTAWAGLYETTPDHQAILGPVDEVPGLWCACGFSGHGFMQAPAAGLVLAQQLCGETPEVDVAAFSHRRFATGGLAGERNVI